MSTAIGLENVGVSAPAVNVNGNAVNGKGAVQRGVKPVKSERLPVRDAAEDEEYTGDDNENEALRKEFVKALRVHAGATEGLRDVIGRAVSADIEPETMVEWGTDEGFSESYVRSTVSAILRAGGVSRRKKGAGRKAPKDAESLLAYARAQFGDKAQAMLRAACRLAEKEDKETAKAAAVKPAKE